MHDGTRSDIDALLLIGVDQFSDVVLDDSYNNDRCADFLLLLVIDHASGTCDAIHINRDTMTEMDILGIAGKKSTRRHSKSRCLIPTVRASRIVAAIQRARFRNFSEVWTLINMCA